MVSLGETRKDEEPFHDHSSIVMISTKLVFVKHLSTYSVNVRTILFGLCKSIILVIDIIIAPT